MASVAATPVERVILRDISWDLYQHLIRELGDAPGTRVTFDQGLLQIMVISAAHDLPNRTLASIVEVVAAETRTNVCHLGSTTFQRPDLLKGFEPDSCFYFRYARVMRGRRDIDLTVDPAPELVIEVDVTSKSLDRFAIFAAVGVEEVWRYVEGEVSIYRLQDGEYVKASRSVVLPLLTPQAVSAFAASHSRTDWPEWVDSLRGWVRQQ